MEREEAGGMRMLGTAQIGFGLVADTQDLRLFLVGWDVPALFAQFPVRFGVRR